METLLKKLYQLSHESPTYSFRYQNPDCSEYRVEVASRGLILQYIGIIPDKSPSDHHPDFYPEEGVEKCAQIYLETVFDNPDVGILPCLSLLMTRWRNHRRNQPLMRWKIEEFNDSEERISMQTSIKYILRCKPSGSPSSYSEVIARVGYANAPSLAYSLEHAALRVLLALARDEPAEIPMESMSTFSPQKASKSIISYHHRLAALDHGTFESGDGRDSSSFTFEVAALQREGELLVKSFFCQSCGRTIEDSCEC